MPKPPFIASLMEIARQSVLFTAVGGHSVARSDFFVQIPLRPACILPVRSPQYDTIPSGLIPIRIFVDLAPPRPQPVNPNLRPAPAGGRIIHLRRAACDAWLQETPPHASQNFDAPPQPQETGELSS